jgi:hypothetical protein
MPKAHVGPRDKLSGGDGHTFLFTRGRVGENKIPFAFQIHDAHVTLGQLTPVLTAPVVVLVLVLIAHVLVNGSSMSLVAVG